MAAHYIARDRTAPTMPGSLISSPSRFRLCPLPAAGTSIGTVRRRPPTGLGGVLGESEEGSSSRWCAGQDMALSEILSGCYLNCDVRCVPFYIPNRAY